MFNVNTKQCKTCKYLSICEYKDFFSDPYSHITTYLATAARKNVFDIKINCAFYSEATNAKKEDTTNVQEDS